MALVLEMIYLTGKINEDINKPKMDSFVVRIFVKEKCLYFSYLFKHNIGISVFCHLNLETTVGSNSDFNFT